MLLFGKLTCSLDVTYVLEKIKFFQCYSSEYPKEYIFSEMYSLRIIIFFFLRNIRNTFFPDDLITGNFKRAQGERKEQ